MPTLLAQDDRKLILQRLQRLTPESKPSWGTLTAPRLLCHLSDQLRVALGEQPVTRRDTPFSRTLLKWLVVYSPLRAPPGKVSTAPEMLTTSPGVWKTDRERCESLIQRLAVTPTTAVHPMFGPSRTAAGAAWRGSTWIITSGSSEPEASGGFAMRWPSPLGYHC
jgi:hypothetical protein